MNKKYNIFRMFWDLLLIVLFSFVLILLPTVFPLRYFFGFLLIFFAPGYVFLSTLWPEKRDLDAYHRLVLSPGLSIIVVSLLMSILYFLFHNISSRSCILSLVLFIDILTLIAIVRRKNAVDPWILDMPNLLLNKKYCNTTMLLLFFLLVLSSLLSYDLTVNYQSGSFTEFYLLDQNGKILHYPLRVHVGENLSVVVGVSNHEKTVTTYYVQVWVVNITDDTVMKGDVMLLDTFNTTLSPRPFDYNSRWDPQFTKVYTFHFYKSGHWQIWFFLCKNNKQNSLFVRNKHYANLREIFLDMIKANNSIESIKLDIFVHDY